MSPVVFLRSDCLRMVIALLLLLCCPATCPAQSTLEVKEVKLMWSKGPVDFVADDGSVRTGRPAKGATLSAGDTVRVGKEGAAELALAGGGTMRIEAASEVKLPLKKEETAASGSLELLKGTLFIKVDGAAIKKQGKQEFRLKTPAAILAVKGTRFFVSSSLQSDTIGVHEGEVSVLVIESKKIQQVRAGTAIETSARGLPLPRPLNEAENWWQTMYPADPTVPEGPAGAPATAWTTDYFRALETAKNEHKYVLIVVDHMAVGPGNMLKELSAEPAFVVYARANLSLVGFYARSADGKTSKDWASRLRPLDTKFDIGSPGIAIIDVHGEKVGHVSYRNRNARNLVSDVKAAIDAHKAK